MVVAGTTLKAERKPGKWVETWFVAGLATGTLLYSSEARYLFACWDTAGRLVYRARSYALAADPSSAGSDTP